MTNTNNAAFWMQRPTRNACVAAVAAMAMVMLLGTAGCSSSTEAQAQAASVATAHNVTLSKAQRQHIRLFTVGTSSWHKTVTTTGTVDFDHDQATSVLAPFSGPVQRVLVNAGDTVREGQALAIVDSPDFAQAISAYRKARASAIIARRLADQDKDLLQHQGVSRREQQQAETDAIGAEADRDAALQALVALNVDAATLKAVRAGHAPGHAYGTIRAPISGTVVDKSISPGQLLQAGETGCFTIADLSKVWVQAQVFGSDLDAVRKGDSAVVLTGAGATALPGKVVNIGAAVDPDNRSVSARVLVDNPDAALKKGMYVRVRITAQKPSHGELVPVSAMLRDDQNLPFVYVAEADGSFARRHVALGDRIDDYVSDKSRDGKGRGEDRQAITDGLHKGDQVVADGAIFVQFMQNQ